MKTFYAKEITTPIGKMLIVADEDFLYCSKFINETTPQTIDALLETYNAKLIQKTNKILELTKHELNSYFNNKLKKFTIPLKLTGTEFQTKCWK